MPIVQEATEYDNLYTVETTIIILNEAIWMVDKMEHTLVNPKKLRSYEITAQDNSFANFPIFMSMEDHEFSLPLLRKLTVLGVYTRTSTNKEFQNLPYIIL